MFYFYTYIQYLFLQCTFHQYLKSDQKMYLFINQYLVNEVNMIKYL